MKNKNIALWMLFPLFASCHSTNCKVEGEVENAQPGDTLLISRMEGGYFITEDTIILKEGGKFTIQGECDSTAIYTFFYRTQKDEIYNDIFFMEPGNINLHIGNETQGKGNPNNDVYYQFLDSIYHIHHQMNILYQSATDSLEFAETFQGTEEISRMDEHINQLIKNTIRRHIQQPVGFYLFQSCYNVFTPEENLELISKLPASYQKYEIIQNIETYVKKELDAARLQRFVDMALPTLQGGTLTFSDIIKKHPLTLIECWASWCDPCRKEMPNLVSLYQKFHPQGLEIIGVSFDENKEAWIKAVQDMGMNWPQTSELRAWDNKMVQQYGITSIPYTILISKEGEILARQLRGKELEDFIADYLLTLNP